MDSLVFNLPAKQRPRWHYTSDWTTIAGPDGEPMEVREIEEEDEQEPGADALWPGEAEGSGTEPEWEVDEPDLEDALEPVDSAEVPPDQVEKKRHGGVRCWEVLGAYGYEAGVAEGTPWLLRSYYMQGTAEWAHFFRQLPGTPAYVVCDHNPSIRAGVELAWRDPATRPRVVICESHVIKALQKRFPKEPDLARASERLRDLDRGPDSQRETVRGQRDAQQLAPTAQLGQVQDTSAQGRPEAPTPGAGHPVLPRGHPPGHRQAAGRHLVGGSAGDGAEVDRREAGGPALAPPEPVPDGPAAEDDDDRAAEPGRRRQLRSDH